MGLEREIWHCFSCDYDSCDNEFRIQSKFETAVELARAAGWSFSSYQAVRCPSHKGKRQR